MGRVCMVRDLVAELVMDRVCHGPSLLWAEMSRTVLGPLLFLVFINDCVDSRIRLFADDVSSSSLSYPF